MNRTIGLYNIHDTIDTCCGNRSHKSTPFFGDDFSSEMKISGGR